MSPYLGGRMMTKDFKNGMRKTKSYVLLFLILFLMMPGCAGK